MKLGLMILGYLLIIQETDLCYYPIPLVGDQTGAYLRVENTVSSGNAYNSLGVGTTQLYNERTVYNHKRHGLYKLGNRMFQFRIKPHFPKKVTEEFLLVDLVNNVDTLAEDRNEVLKNVYSKVHTMDMKKLKLSVAAYGNVKAKKIFAPLLQSQIQ